MSSLQSVLKNGISQREAEEKLAKQKLAHDFVSLLCKIFDSLQETFPECNQTRIAKMTAKKMLLGNAKKETALIQEWHDAFSQDVTKCSYRRAFCEITGWAHMPRYACVYYNDWKNVLAMEHDYISKMDLKAKYNDPGLDEESRTCLENVLAELCTMARQFTGHNRGYSEYPSREALLANIEQRKQQKEAAKQRQQKQKEHPMSAPMTEASYASICMVYDAIKALTVDDQEWGSFCADVCTRYAGDETTGTDSRRSVIDAWSQLLRSPVDASVVSASASVSGGGGDNSSSSWRALILDCAKVHEEDNKEALLALVQGIVTAEHYDALRLCAPFSGGGGGIDPATVSVKQCNDCLAALKKLANFEKVTGTIPNGMMHNIESVAASLMDGLQSGNMSAADFDLSQIGSKVLEQCSENDISQLAENMGDLLPCIQDLSCEIAGSTEASNILGGALGGGAAGGGVGGAGGLASMMQGLSGMANMANMANMGNMGGNGMSSSSMKSIENQK